MQKYQRYITENAGKYQLHIPGCTQHVTRVFKLETLEHFADIENYTILFIERYLTYLEIGVRIEVPFFKFFDSLESVYEFISKNQALMVY